MTTAKISRILFASFTSLTPFTPLFFSMPSRHHLSRKGQNAAFALKREAGFAKRRKAKAIRMRKLEASSAK